MTTITPPLAAGTLARLWLAILLLRFGKVAAAVERAAVVAPAVCEAVWSSNQ